MTAVDLNLYLEIFNGSWAILSLYAVIFLLYHLSHIGSQRDVGMRHWMFGNIPQSMQLALAILAVSAGVFISRAPIWYWRMVTGGDFASFDITRGFLTFGAGLGCVGFMCLIRVVTRPMTSGWPPLLAAASVVAYVVSRLAYEAFS